jgi:hypothetical protein
MRKLLVKIVQLLDGTPAVYGERQSGQSVVELALITPLLIVLLAGLVEIGWFANNYLNLLDVTRAGARRGAVLQDQKSPLFWENQYTYVPQALLPAAYRMDFTSVDDTEINRFWYRWMPADTAPSGSNTIAGSTGIEPCQPDFRDRTFYSEVICTMITTMEPLELNLYNGVDDIVVSAFAMQQVPDATVLAAYPGRALDSNGPQVIVAGRYPTNANECNLYNTPGGPVRSETVAFLDQYRDPFDIDGQGDVDIKGYLGGTFTELAGYDALGGTDGLAEKQIGFALFGNHRIDNTYCIGSEWTMKEIQDLMNLATYDQTTDILSSAPSQGVVLAEIFWQHEMLLKLPVLSPVYTAVGDENGLMVINIWAAFPLSSVEPHIFD